MRSIAHLAPVLVLATCTLEPGSAQQTGPACTNVPTAFVYHVDAVLSDSTDLFQGAYPPATPLTCEILGMLQEALDDDSARYCFERLSMKYWNVDPHARITHRHIERHMSFPLAMAVTAHWNEDHRILALRELQEFRRTRPMVCTTMEGSAELEEQDRTAVRYLIKVVETTPIFIGGSENSTIHDMYMRTVMETLDLFTGQAHGITGDRRMRVDMSVQRVAEAIADWRNWLDE
ncbi:MAG: hypothetical protein KDC00_08345 [Flavobacteriales bacterium]|nr:hypothetical protein [Flavobacteriales bacterium]